MRPLIYAVAGLIAGALLFYIFFPIPDPVEYTNVVVREIKGEPDTVRTIVDRIVYREREPDLTVTQPGGGQDVVNDFCRPDTVVQVTQGDTVWVQADTVYLLRSVVNHPGWFLQRDQIITVGPTSAGDLREMRFRSYPGWSIRTAPEVLFREPRFGLVRQLLEAGIYVGLGYTIGRIF